MPRQIRVHALVGIVTALSAAVTILAWATRSPFPGWWAFGTFLAVAFVLEMLNTRLRIAARGSTSFIIHMAAGVLFGGLWAGLIAGLSTLLGERVRGNTPLKTLFNIAQRMLSVAAAVLLYQALGGDLPPAYLKPGFTLSSLEVQRDLGLFFLFATTYFGINSAAVSAAIALTTDRTFREVWTMNTRGVLGYDLGASAISVLVAWLYTRFEFWLGFGPVGLIGTIVPIIAVRHVYSLYHQLQDSGQELLQVMVKAIEARDPYTSGHSLRVSRLSRAIAAELGLSAKELEQVETAALLHDVGKIYEEFAPLLRKEQRLTADETALMQTHATKSAELVGIISKFRGAIQDSVRHHHERWDGQGYPDGVASNEIPLAARIILVADTIDAMITDRPYRKRLSLDVVVSELQKCSGTQFDPQIVSCVISSVAVRRLVADVPGEETTQVEPSRSRRVSWPSASIWRVRRAL